MTPLQLLAQAYGIVGSFTDVTGQTHAASDETLAEMLGAIGVPAGSDAAIATSLEAFENKAALPSVVIAREGRLELPGVTGNWSLTDDTGGTRTGQVSGNLEIADLPVGWHTLRLDRTGEEVIALSPPLHAPLLETVTGQTHIWGLAAPIYGMTGPDDLGLGTYRDLAAMACEAASLGADYLAINPVHALSPTDPNAYSPYSPSHRRFLNTAHIDPRAVPEFDSTVLDAGEAIPNPSRNLIDYTAHSARLAPLLEALSARFFGLPENNPRRLAFQAWRKKSGPDLEVFALYEALSERYGPYWHAWPPALQSSCTSETRAQAEHLSDHVDHHAYLQWVAQDQLSAAQRSAEAGGMAVGLMLDLAVGVRPDGAETWAQPDLFARNVSIGAPPDAFNTQGQDWGLAPLNPIALKGPGLAAFGEMLRGPLCTGGALRIDHVLGFRRNYWISHATGEGAYIRFPEQYLLAVAAIEAHRAGSLVIGEDLGNVPEGLRETLDASGVYGCRVMIFQRGADGSYDTPDTYTRRAMASLGSHDLPSIQEWWEERDLDVLRALGVLTDEMLRYEKAERSGSRASLARMLEQAGFPAGNTLEEAALAAHAALARTASGLVTVQVENLLPELNRLNVPGIIDDYPNWRMRLPPLETLAHHPFVRRVLDLISRGRADVAARTRENS